MTDFPAHIVTWIFLFFFFTATALQLYLSVRQSRAVLRSRPAVPPDFAAGISLEAHQKAVDYTLAKQRLARWEILFQAAVLAAFLGFGLNLLALGAQTLADNALMQGVWLIVLFLAVNYLLALPFDIYRTFRLEAGFGFNRTTAKTFFLDQIKGLLLGAVLAFPLAAVVVYLMGAMGKNWWLYVWAALTLFSLGMMWIFPAWIAPLFNRFQPLADAALQEKIENLLTRTGFHSKGVFVMDGSKRSGHGNAYFTGVGKNKRIVFFDTLLEKLDADEIEAVLAHELGHFKYGHVKTRMMLHFVLTLGFLWILSRLMLLPQFYLGLGVVYPSHAMALLLFLLVLPVAGFVFTPAGSMLSRRHEYQADAFAVQHADGQKLVHALTKLYRDNAAALVSDPLYSLFYDSHPGAHARIGALRKKKNIQAA